MPHPNALAQALREDEDQAGRSEYLRVFANSRTADTLLANDTESLRRIFDWKVPRDRIEEHIERLAPERGESGVSTLRLCRGHDGRRRLGPTGRRLGLARKRQRQ